MVARARAALPAACLALLLCAPAAPGQVDVEDSRDDRLESFLRGLGARELLAEHLLARLDESTGSERVAVAERLGRVYADMLTEADGLAEQARLIELSGALLDRVPAADTFDLRIALTKARYMTAEHSAERARLRLADDAEVRDAVEAMDSIAAGLSILGEQADRRVDAIERRERAGNVSDLQALRTELAEARRQRSLAKYYAGWALYYTAMLTGRPGPAGEALTEFGYLLGADGSDPTVEGLARSLLRYEHVARAAMGVALCHSIRGSHADAVMWIDELERQQDVNPSVLAQLFQRKVSVLTAARRWDSLARAVADRRGAGLDDRATTPLRINEARLLAVEVLEAFRAPDADARRREAAEPVVRAALADLVARGETAQVLNLVDRYGTLPLGEGGFIPRYVRALRSYRAARELHAQSGADAAQPTSEPELVAAYLDAADLLTHAFSADDAQNFNDERLASGLMLGLALYYKDSPLLAAERFEQTAQLASPGERHAEALWMAAVALERAIEAGRGDLRGRLNAAVLLFVQTYPGDERSARLMLRFGQDNLFDTESVIAVLMKVGRDSPIHTAARQRVADVLYRAYARSTEPRKSELAARFVSVALPLIEGLVARVRDADTPVAEAATLADDAVLRIRQTLDATLTPLAPDAGSARRVLSALDELRVRTGRDIARDELAGEIAFRRLQLAIAEGDETDRAAAHEELERIGGRFLEAADGFLFGRALESWQRTRGVAEAQRVVQIGTRLLGDGEIPRTRLGVAESTAAAAAALWKAQNDRVMLSTAISIDERIAADHAPTADLLRRLGRNAEQAGDAARALEVWRRLAVSLREGEGDWFEARYETIRLLADTQPDAARAALRQHRILYPMMGPSPWGERLEGLDARLRGGGTGGGTGGRP